MTTIEQLGEQENNLYSMLDLNIVNPTPETLAKLNTIFQSYRQIHLVYSKLATEQDEAFKRGLFIQWYAITEPSDLTGISELDEQAELNIIKVLENKIQTDTLDNELIWMLNYYADWDYVFNRFENFAGLKNFVQNRTDKYFPSKIDRQEMNARGQMGRYWNSLTVFADEKKASH